MYERRGYKDDSAARVLVQHSALSKSEKKRGRGRAKDKARKAPRTRTSYKGKGDREDSGRLEDKKSSEKPEGDMVS
jgi:hypothetical protein